MGTAGSRQSPGRTRFWLALGVAVALLVGGRWTYAYLEARYAQAFESVRIQRGSLERLPMVIGSWHGRDEPVSAALLQVTDTDDHVSRSYASKTGQGMVSLWLGYGGRFRDLVPHRPEVCYPGNGYTLEGQERHELMSDDGVALPCRVLFFARGDLQSERIAVLNYYLVDGEYSPDVSLLRQKAMRFRAGGRYMAQVQIVSRYDPLGSAPSASVRAFAADSAGPIRRAVQSAVQSALAGSQEPGK